MSSAPLVSILIPAFNAEPWIAQTVESALAQTWRPLEIIVVNDGSTDGTRDVAARYEKSGVRVLSQENRGASAASNAALRASSGSFIKFFDSDDLLGADIVARQMERLLARPNCVAAAEWGRFRSDPSTTAFVPEPVWRDLRPVEWMVAACANARPMMQCGAWLIPRTILDRCGGWDERLSLINDFEFFSRVILSVDEVLFTSGARLFYRSGHAPSLSSRRTREALQSALLSLELGTQQLLAVEDSARTRRVTANLLQDFIYDAYPEHADLRARAAERIRALGGADIAPDGPPGFQALRRVLGWKLARRIQHAAMHVGLNRASLRQRFARELPTS